MNEERERIVRGVMPVRQGPPAYGNSTFSASGPAVVILRRGLNLIVEAVLFYADAGNYRAGRPGRLSDGVWISDHGDRAKAVVDSFLPTQDEAREFMSPCPGLFPHTWDGQECRACLREKVGEGLGGLRLAVGEWFVAVGEAIIEGLRSNGDR